MIWGVCVCIFGKDFPHLVNEHIHDLLFVCVCVCVCMRTFKFSSLSKFNCTVYNKTCTNMQHSIIKYSHQVIH